MAVVHDKFVGAANGGSVPAMDTRGKGLIIIAVPYYTGGGGLVAPTDDQGNAPFDALTLQASSLTGIRIYYKENPNTSATHNISVGGSGSYEAAFVAAFDGSWTYASKQDGTHKDTNDNTIQCSTGVTPAEDGDLIIAASASAGDGSALTINGGFTITDQTLYDPGNHFAGMLAYLIQGTAGLANPTVTNIFNSIGFGGSSMALAVFKLAGTTVTVPGTAVTASAGTMTAAYDKGVAITGGAITASAGTLSFVIGPQVSIAGTQVTCSAGDLTETISTSVNFTGAAITCSAGTVKTVESITIDDPPAANYTYPKDDGQTYGTVTVTGTYKGTNAPTVAIQLKCDVVGGGSHLGYTSLSSFSATAIDGSHGTWTGTIQVPVAHPLKFTPKEPVSGLVGAAQTIQFGVGTRAMTGGHSQQMRMGAVNTQAGLTADPHGSYWVTDNVTGIQSDGLYTADVGVTGSGNGPPGINAMINEIRALMLLQNPSSTEPVFVFDPGIAGSLIADHKSGGSAYNNMVSSNGTANAAVGARFHVVNLHIGTNNCTTGGSVAAAATDLPLIVTTLKALTGAPKIGIVIEGSVAASGYVDSKFNTLRAAQLAQAAQSDCYIAAVAIDMLPGGDLIHWITAQYGIMGVRMGRGFGKQLGLSTTGGAGPAITSGYWVVGTSEIILNVTHDGGTSLVDGTGDAAGTGVLGTVVSASGGQSITSRTLRNGKLVLGMSAARGVGETVTVQHLLGQNPFSYDGTDVKDDVIFDNQNIGLTNGFPLQPLLAALAIGERGTGSRRSGGMLLGVGRLLGR